VIVRIIKERRPNGAATVMNNQPVLDRQAAATLIAGALLLAISFFSNIGYGPLIHLRAAALDEQIGVCLHLAALAMLNWRPVYDIEQETRRLREETARIRKSNERLLAVLQLSDSSWPTPPSADSD
jgi:hypothetical protein